MLFLYCTAWLLHCLHWYHDFSLDASSTQESVVTFMNFQGQSWLITLSDQNLQMKDGFANKGKFQERHQLTHLIQFPAQDPIQHRSRLSPMVLGTICRTGIKPGSTCCKLSALTSERPFLTQSWCLLALVYYYPGSSPSLGRLLLYYWQ